MKIVTKHHVTSIHPNYQKNGEKIPTYIMQAEPAQHKTLYLKKRLNR